MIARPPRSRSRNDCDALAAPPSRPSVDDAPRLKDRLLEARADVLLDFCIDTPPAFLCIDGCDRWTSWFEALSEKDFLLIFSAAASASLAASGTGVLAMEWDAGVGICDGAVAAVPHVTVGTASSAGTLYAGAAGTAVLAAAVANGSCG